MRFLSLFLLLSGCDTSTIEATTTGSSVSSADCAEGVVTLLALGIPYPVETDDMGTRPVSSWKTSADGESLYVVCTAGSVVDVVWL